MKTYDLRSDTVTQPTPAMRAAMANAPVGDDVYGDDPTVNRLQEQAASLLGKEAGLFLPSGTMGNLAAILAHCGRGDEAIMGNLGHTFLFEAGGVAALAGVNPHTLPNQPDGTLRLEDLAGAVRSEDAHFPTSRLVILENTHNRCGGVPISVEYTRAVGEFAHSHGMSLHIDGARIFNAAAALGVPARELVDPADSVTFCLSKGLAAPVGSVLCGSREFIYRAHRARKQLGGGMRQAGILAAAGLVALDCMIDRLAEDHRRAQALASGLAAIPGVRLFMGQPQTNMVFIELDENLGVGGRQLIGGLAEQGIRIGSSGPRRFRLVLHNDIDDAGVEQALAAFKSMLVRKSVEN